MRIRIIPWRAMVGILLSGALLAAVLILMQKRGWREPPVAGGPATLRLITAEQYTTIVHELFGRDIKVELALSAPQRRQGLIALGASGAVVTPSALEQFERAARTVAMQVVDEAHRASLVPCVPSSVDAPDNRCARQFFAHVGRFLYRRPLSEMELKSQASAAAAATRELGDFYGGLGYGLAGMLASHKFIHFMETTEPDPARPGQMRLDGYAKATRLSLFLWNTTPDEMLLAAAESGELHEGKGLQRQVDRLLASSRLEGGVRAFFSDWLDFDKFDTLSKDPVIYPEFTVDVAPSVKEQTLRLLTDHLLLRKGDYRDLFTTPSTFVDANLGPLYQLPVPNPRQWMVHQADRTRSAGLLTSLSFLTLHSHPGRSSPTQRGKAIRELLLCQKVPDPPPNVNFSTLEDPNRRFKTARERLGAHSEDAVCAGCHKITDPMGLALENFDGAGRYREKEGDAWIDTSGELDGRPFENVAGLGLAMSEHTALGPCLMSRLFAYGVGRELGVADRPWLDYIAKRFATHDYRVPELLREITISRAFFALTGSSQGRGQNMQATSTAVTRQNSNEGPPMSQEKRT